MRREPTAYDHKPDPLNPDAKGDFGYRRKWARCQKCNVWLLRTMRGDRDVWQHRQRAWH